jgi:hypothetical protein
VNGGGRSTRDQAVAYIRLCHHPTRDIRSWIKAGDRLPIRVTKAPESRLKSETNRAATLTAWKVAREHTRSSVKTQSRPTTKTKGGNHAQTRQHRTRNIAEHYIRLCQNPLHDLRGWLDAHQHRGTSSRGLSSRPVAGMATYGDVRPLRAERNSRTATHLIAAHIVDRQPTPRRPHLGSHGRVCPVCRNVVRKLRSHLAEVHAVNS